MSITRERAEMLAAHLHALDFGHAFTLDEHGHVGDSDLDAPDAWHVEGASYPREVELDGPGWEALLPGRTGQHGYRGTVLHASETLSEGMAADLVDLVETHDAFALQPVEVNPEDLPTDELAAYGIGWAEGDLSAAELLAMWHAGTWAPEPAGWVVIGHRRDAHPDDCRYCAAGEGQVHQYEPPTD